MRIERSRISIPNVREEVSEAILKGELVYGSHIDLLRLKFTSLGHDKFFDFTSNGFSALFVTIKAHKIINKKIIIPFPQTCMALISAIRASGNEVLYSDCQLNNPNLDQKKLNETISQNEDVAAVISPAYFGIYEPFELEDKSVIVIEDLCQSILTYSSENLLPSKNCKVFSFYPSKNLIGIDGGCIASNKEDIHSAIAQLSSYNSLKKDDGAIHFNLRLNNINALIANSDFDSLKEKAHKRKVLWKSYVSLFEKSKNIDLIASNNNSWISFKALVKLKDKANRDAFITELNQKFEIESCTELNAPNEELKEQFPNSKIWFDSSCSIPFYEGLSDSELDYLVTSISNSEHF